MKRFRGAAILILALLSTGLYAKGPKGFGELVLGMSKSQVERINAEANVHLASQLIPFKSKNRTPVAGMSVFKTTIQSPLDEKPLEATLKFKDEKLIYIGVAFGDDTSIFRSAKKMIVAKYGPPDILDTTIEKQCVLGYSSIAIKYGKTVYSWVDVTTGPYSVETKLIKGYPGICPFGDMDRIRILSMTISYTDREAANQVNPF